MMLNAVKQGKSWDAMAANFNVSTTLFEKTVNKFTAVAKTMLVKVLVTDFEKKFTMQDMQHAGHLFTHHSYCCHATNV